MSTLVYVREQLGDGCTPRFDRARRRLDPASLWYRRSRRDDIAVEAALRCTRPGQPVTVVAIGPERIESTLTHYVATGATAAMRVWSPVLEQVEIDDSLAASLLKGAVERLAPDWIMCGDDEHGAVSVHLAELTGRALATSVIDVACHDDGLDLRRRLNHLTETARLTAPGIIAVKRGPALRYPSHRDRLAARRQTVTRLDAADALDAIGSRRRRPAATAITPPKPPTTRRRELDRSDRRVAALILGGTGGGGHSHVIEDTVPNMARLAVATILDRVNSTTPTNPTIGDTP